MAGRYRCGECGNLTRFDVVTTRRTKAFHHFSVAGDLTIEDEEVIEEHVDDLVCRWCGAGRERIETLSPDEPLLDGLSDASGRHGAPPGRHGAPPGRHDAPA